MGRPKINGVCSLCERQAEAKGLCGYHYRKQRLIDDPSKIKSGIIGSPFYNIWFSRKQSNELCEAWLDFKKFEIDIQPKPEGNYLLLKIKGDEPYGPNNFRWQEHLKRKEGESKKDWWARKREARLKANPAMDDDRNLKKNFGLTREQYNEKAKFQNFVCAICKEPENGFSARTGNLKRLAVDHCHQSVKLKIRGLLCWRCNGTLGKVNDSVELLQKMVDYLNKHRS